MLRSASESHAGTVVSAQVCIVGAGPAGLTLARELASAACKVLLVESGDFRYRRKLKELNEGDTFGDQYPNPRWQRVRQVGGCSNKWLVDIGNGQKGARFVPLDPIDFEKRDWIPNSGWPITRDDLDPHYARAHRHCGIGPPRYDVEAWGDVAAFAIQTPGLETTMFQFGAQSRWISGHDHLFMTEPNIEVMLGATVTEIETNPSGDVVTGLKVINPAGASIAVKSDLFILSVGCIETTRLLLNSNAVHANGLGNQFDVVGRYFMDHPQSYLNVLTPRNRNIFDKCSIYDIRSMGDMAVMAKLAFRKSALEEHQLPNSCHLLFPRRDHFLSDAFQAFFSVVLDVKHKSIPRNLIQRGLTMAKGAGDLLPIALWAAQGRAYYPYLAKGGWAELSQKSDLFTTFEVWSMFEQLPNPENRVGLSAKRDYNGTRKIEIHWRFTDDDRKSVTRIREQFGREIEAGGIGKVAWSREPISTPTSVHPIGGARMGHDPRTSVVDRDLKVHGVKNLFVASSAVFPTSGYANPTLTVVALACRLADRIKTILASQVTVRSEPLAEQPAPIRGAA